MFDYFMRKIIAHDHDGRAWVLVLLTRLRGARARVIGVPASLLVGKVARSALPACEPRVIWSTRS
jgi:hypothetical protein